MDEVNLTGAVWRKARASGGTGGECVEVATIPPDVIAVRDSKDPAEAVLLLSLDQWRAFTWGVRRDEFGVA
ncbi:hypothetical protein Misp01_13490 [Microtetraspora sp. NBRC 13810]|uniref:DUF397 domain-containing protein n=1 Tax=Microtetraspora sp. NBRC 13810 TaxID=3030990 RepID=UPI0024A09C1E|nr:DUF397 domain-containing protein [Microtetraspora sp. NBRC 13810]GLW06219.1 hypothetical protein Misp01_13490 [Microtetraspora sp. NBRC 13810]